MAKIYSQEPLPNQVSSLILPPQKTRTTTEVTATAAPKQQKRKHSRVRRTDFLCRKLASSVSYNENNVCIDDGSNKNADPHNTTCTQNQRWQQYNNQNIHQMETTNQGNYDTDAISSQPPLTTRTTITATATATTVAQGGKASKLEWLQKRLKLNATSSGKIIRKYPPILNKSIEECIEPKIEWLQERLQLNATSAGKIIQKCPRILGLSVSENMEPKLDWLQKRLDLNDYQLSEMVRKHPRVLCLPTPHKMEPTLLWLQDRLCLSDNGLSQVLMRFPALLGCNVSSNLAPTFKFYEQCIGTKEAQAELTSNPSFLCTSLEKRLKPRLEEVKNLGFEVNSVMIRRISKYTEDQWCKSIARKRNRNGM